MVAYTTPDCLPYFEGTDSPCLNTGTTCEPSSLWCDFAEIVESRLTAFDGVVARTATSTPMAWVQTTQPVTHGVGAALAVPFDTNLVDTDNMVDLDLNSAGFQVVTSGLYMVFIYAKGTIDIAPGDTINPSLVVQFLPLSQAFGAFTVTDLTANTNHNVDGETITLGGHMVLPLTAGQTASARFLSSGVTGDSTTYSKVGLGAAWMGDMP